MEEMEDEPKTNWTPPLAERSREQLSRRLRRLSISVQRLETQASDFFARPAPTNVEAARMWAQRGRQISHRIQALRQARADHQKEIFSRDS